MQIVKTSCRTLHLMYDLTGERLKGSEEELAGAVGAIGVEEGDSD